MLGGGSIDLQNASAQSAKPSDDHKTLANATLSKLARCLDVMSIDALISGKSLVRRPVRLKRSAKLPVGAVDVGPGTKWANPIKRRDVETLVSSEPDIAEACKRRGWKAGAALLYRDYVLEEGLGPNRTSGKRSRLYL